MQKYLNHVFAAEVILFFLIIFGVLPRWFAFVLAGILIIYTIFASLEDATVLFVRSIPLFIALPFTASFDNFNTWRILALIIFIKWAIAKRSIPKINIPLVSLFAISLLSILVAQDTTAAVMRVIYFVNLSMVAIVIYELPDKRRIMLNLIPPLVIVIIVGFVQLITAYALDIYQFVDLWGWGAQCRQFGMEWCRIAVEQGNTWFTYNTYGQINLRMFSLFTDSHTFPMFILMALPSVFALMPNKKHWPSLVITFGFFAAILSNTRGIWLAGWVTALIVWCASVVIKKPSFRMVAGWLAVFVLLFSLIYPLSVIPQFHQWSGEFTLKNRLGSLINFGETSNALRIAIWKASLTSIKHHPLLGVGIGNFPVVLQQDVALAKAGSSAHNVYLHIAAELGIPALLLALAFLVLVLKRAYDKGEYAMAICLLWICGYLLTDAALFDERAFLIFSVVVAITLSHEPTRQH